MVKSRAQRSNPIIMCPPGTTRAEQRVATRQCLSRHARRRSDATVRWHRRHGQCGDRGVLLPRAAVPNAHLRGHAPRGSVTARQRPWRGAELQRDLRHTKPGASARLCPTRAPAPSSRRKAVGATSTEMRTTRGAGYRGRASRRGSPWRVPQPCRPTLLPPSRNRRRSSDTRTRVRPSRATECRAARLSRGPSGRRQAENQEREAAVINEAHDGRPWTTRAALC